MSTKYHGHELYKRAGGRTGLGTGARGSMFGKAKVRKYVNSQATNKFQNILNTIPNDGRRMRQEVKVIDTENITLNFSSTVKLQYLNLVREGSGFWNRIGRKVSGQSLHLTGYVKKTNGNAAALQSDYNRVIVFYDRQANGAPIAFSDLIQSTAQDGTTFSNSAIDGINMNNRERFIVLMDRRIVTPGVGIMGVTDINTQIVTDPNNDGSDSSFKVTRFIKLKGLETHFLSNSVPITIADITTGAIGVLTISEFGLNEAEAWTLLMNARYKFRDN